VPDAGLVYSKTPENSARPEAGIVRPVALVSVPSPLVFSTFALLAAPMLLTTFPYLSVTAAWALNFLLAPMLVVLQANGHVPASRAPALTSAFDQAKRSAVAALTVKAPVVTSIVPSFALSVVLWASLSFSEEAVPTPSEKVTAVAVDGYSGAVALGELAGPFYAIVFAPV